MTDRVMEIRDRTRGLLRELPEGIALVAAAKTRSAEEVRAAIEGGVRIIGHNYVQEADSCVEVLKNDEFSAIPRVKHHLIGHLQRNKVRQAVRLFDAIQTLDSLRLARAVDAACEEIDRRMPVLIEINSAREAQKAGVVPEEAEELIREIAQFRQLRIDGLMTMGPFVDDPERLRPFFAATKDLFDRIAQLAIPGASMTTLSMGMSDSYRVGIDEGATMIRLGTVLFGPRKSSLNGDPRTSHSSGDQ